MSSRQQRQAKFAAIRRQVYALALENPSAVRAGLARAEEERRRQQAARARPPPKPRGRPRRPVDRERVRIALIRCGGKANREAAELAKVPYSSLRRHVKKHPFDASELAYGTTVSAEHARALASFGITPEVAAARGYRTIIRKGVSRLRCPLWTIDSNDPRSWDLGQREIAGVLGSSRRNWRAGRVIDCPPLSRPWVEDVACELYVVGSPFAADALTSVGEAVVALCGPQPMPTSAWAKIPLEGRTVTVIFGPFDTPSYETVSVLEELGAHVLSWLLPPIPGREKPGIEHYIGAGQTDVRRLWALHQLAGGSGGR